MALFLRDEEIRDTVSMDEMIDAIEEMQRHYGQGDSYNLGRRKLIDSGGLLAVMGGGLYYKGVFGVKTYTVVKGRYAFHVTLYDTTTGQLVAFLQANRLGQLRTGATTGVACKYLAMNDAVVVGILGTGYQAPTQLEAVSKVRKLSKVKVYSRNPENRKRFAQEAIRSLDLDVVPAESNREAVEDCPMVICITNSQEPVLDGDWLSPGSLLVSAGPTTWRAREVDDACF